MSIRAASIAVSQPPWAPRVKRHRALMDKSGGAELRPLDDARSQQTTAFVNLNADELHCIFDNLMRNDCTKDSIITIPGMVCISNLAKTCHFFRFSCQDLAKTPFDVGALSPIRNFNLQYVRDDNVTEQRVLIRKDQLSNAKVIDLFEHHGRVSENKLFIARETASPYDIDNLVSPVQIYFGHAIVDRNQDYFMLVRIPIDDFVRTFSGNDTTSLYGESGEVKTFNTPTKRIRVPIFACDRPNDPERSRDYTNFQLAIGISAPRCANIFELNHPINTHNGSVLLSTVAIETGSHVLRLFHRQILYFSVNDFAWLCDFAGRRLPYPHFPDERPKNDDEVNQAKKDDYLRKYAGCLYLNKNDDSKRYMIEPPATPVDWDNEAVVPISGVRTAAVRADLQVQQIVQNVENADVEMDDESDESDESEHDTDSEYEEDDSSSSSDSEDDYQPPPQRVAANSFALVRRRPDASSSVFVDSDSESEDDFFPSPPAPAPAPAPAQVVAAQPIHSAGSAIRIFNTPGEAFDWVNSRTREQRRRESIDFQVAGRSYTFRDDGTSRKWDVSRPSGDKCSKKNMLLAFLGV
jgi:hypothetical protein